MQFLSQNCRQNEIDLKQVAQENFQPNAFLAVVEQNAGLRHGEVDSRTFRVGAALSNPSECAEEAIAGEFVAATDCHRNNPE